ncbi:LysR family transcriptional regulator [Rhizobium sp. 0TCS1.26]|uniref:LysR family transcriptional regulator n=1 Tax=Rhizobium sp. 0TCS1.26 TaxID=3142623 RepID=UPI003D271C8F
MDLHGIDLNLLVAFDALMAERSVTRAGVRIGRTQPAMSAALSRLRTLLGDELFVRSPEGLQPTPRALDLAEPLGRALAEIQRTLSFTQVFDPMISTATLSIGLSEHAAFIVLPKLLATLRQQAPDIVLRVRNLVHRDDAVALLDAGEADITLGVPHAPVGRILSRAFFEESFVCILRRDHPEAGRPLTLEAFLSMSHLLVSPENERFGAVDAALAKRGLQRRLALTLPQLYAAPALIAASDLVATLMEGVVQASGWSDRLYVSPPPLNLGKVTFNMSWHRRNDVHPAQRWLRGIIQTLELGGDV